MARRGIFCRQLMMKSRAAAGRAGLVLLLAMSLVSCGKPKVSTLPPPSLPSAKPPAAAATPAAIPGERVPPTQKPYQINGITYYPLPSAHGYQIQGKASWYGEPFHGRATSNGETYDMYGLSAAHKTLPMNTMLMVKNLENGKELVVRVNDRGPFIRGREIDLSYGAADKLGMVRRGVAKVEVVALGAAEAYRQGGEQYDRFLPYQDLDRGEFFVQVGSFINQSNAEKLMRRLTETGSKVEMQLYDRGSERYHRVLVHAGSSLAAAGRLEERFVASGFIDAFVVAR